jgi:periplasmic copper chaperone A
MRRKLREGPLADRPQSGVEARASSTPALQVGVFALAAVFAGGAAEAHELKAGKLVIVHTWVRATPPGGTVTAGYGKITNTGPDADWLVGASLHGAARSEIHCTTVREGIIKTGPLKDGIPIPAGQTVELTPGSLHITFSGLSSPLEQDMYVDGSLTFEKAGKIAIEFFVEPMESTTPSLNSHDRHKSRERQ